MTFSGHARCVPPPHPPLLVREADDSTLPDQQQHLNVRLTSWWLYRSIWQTLGFTWTHRLRCNLSSPLTDVAPTGKALYVCVWKCVCDHVCTMFVHLCALWAQKRQLLGSGWEPKKPVQAQQGSPFHSAHNNPPSSREHSAWLALWTHSSDSVPRTWARLCPFVSSDW